MTKSKNEVAEAPKGIMGFMAAAGDTNLPAHLKPESNRGNENVGKEDIQVPRIKLFQLISDEVKKSNSAYIEGAEAGMMYNATTGVMTDELYVMNIAYERRWNLWRTRKAGGGLIGSFDSETEARAALTEAAEAEHINLDDTDRVNETFELIDTPEHACLIIDPTTGECTPAIIDMPSTKQKVSRKWNTQLQGMQGDRFAHMFSIKSVMETNRRGEDYFNYTVESVGFADEVRYEKAVEFYEGMQVDIKRRAAETKAKQDAADKAAAEAETVNTQ